MKKFLCMLLVIGISMTGCNGSGTVVKDSIVSNKGTVAKDKGIRLMDYADAVKILEDAGYHKTSDSYLSYYFKDDDNLEKSIGDDYYTTIELNSDSAGFQGYFGLDGAVSFDADYKYKIKLVYNHDLDDVVSEATYGAAIDELVSADDMKASEYLSGYNDTVVDIPVSSINKSDIFETDDFYIVCYNKDYGRLDLTSSDDGKDRFQGYFKDRYFSDAVKIDTADTGMKINSGIFNSSGILGHGGVTLYDSCDNLCGVVRDLDGCFIKCDFDMHREYVICVLIRGTHTCAVMTVSEDLNGSSDSLVADDLALKQFVNEDICSALLSTFKSVNSSPTSIGVE